MITITLYTKKIHNTKNNTTFDKPFVRYRNKTFEAILSKETHTKMLKEGMQFPASLDLDTNDYFMKRVTYTRNDGTHGAKYQIVILGYHNPAPAVFEKITIDDIVDDLDEAKSAATGDEIH